MGNFYLVDQSLKGVGGHHYDYTRLLAQAANESEWPVIVGSHRKFRAHGSLPACQVRNCFRFTTYASCSTLVGIQDMVARRKHSGFLNWLGLNQEASVPRQRTKRIQSFTEDCHSFFVRPLTKDDVIFFTTLSDLEAEGLFQFLRQRSDAKLANWHIQFHFPLFRGRTPEYERQSSNLDYLAKTLAKFNVFPDANIRFYVTSDNLKDQYDRTGLRFEELPYPIDPQLRFSKMDQRNQAQGVSNTAGQDGIRVTFAGAVRDEKGGAQIYDLIHRVEEQIDYPTQFCLQQKKPSLLKRIGNYVRRKQPLLPSNVQICEHPLDPQSYRDFIRKTDIGLLTTYDSEAYFSRRAGILGEYLSGGIPVIVPAGCWLSDQIEVEQRKYLRSLLARMDLDTETVLPKSVSHQSSGKTIASFDLDPIDAAHELAVLEFDVIKPQAHGNYFRIQISDDPQAPNHMDRQIVGKGREAGSQVAAFDWSLSNRSLSNRSLQNAEIPRKMSMEIAPAFGSLEWQVENIRLTRIPSEQVIPRSVIGLVAADQDQTVELTREMISQYEHYRQSAIDFSADWNRNHDPQLTFQTIVSHSILSNSNKSQAA